MDKTVERRLSYFVLFVLLFVLIFISYFSLYFAESALADSEAASVDSDILVDLSHDEDFNYEDYPQKNDDKKLYVIQIAESTDRELLVYVYQPCTAKDFRASSINLSTTRNSNGVYSNYSNYYLTYCNNFGTLYKYKVKNLEVSTAETRYYSISQIMRPFDATIDIAAGYDNTISEVSCSVAKEWGVTYIEGQLFYESRDSEVVEITSKYVGYIHYDNGGIFPWGSSAVATDSHFVAFDTDLNIDELYEAEVQWSESTWTYEILGDYFIDRPDKRIAQTFGSSVVQPVKSLYSDASHSQSSNRIFADYYYFKEIQTVDELLQEEDDIQVWCDNAFFKISGNTQFSAEAKEALENQKWVLRFCETGYNVRTIVNPPVSENIVTRTRISDVIILRLKFKTAGLVYDLGVIDNKQTGSLDPAAETRYRFEATDLLKTILALLLLFLILWLLGYILPVLKALWAIISFPFKLIAKSIHGVKDKRARRAEKKRNEKIDGLIEAVDKQNGYRYRRR